MKYTQVKLWKIDEGQRRLQRINNEKSRVLEEIQNIKDENSLKSLLKRSYFGVCLMLFLAMTVLGLSNAIFSKDITFMDLVKLELASAVTSGLVAPIMIISEALLNRKSFKTTIRWYEEIIEICDETIGEVEKELEELRENHQLKVFTSYQMDGSTYRTHLIEEKTDNNLNAETTDNNLSAGKGPLLRKCLAQKNK